MLDAMDWQMFDGKISINLTMVESTDNITLSVNNLDIRELALLL